LSNHAIGWEPERQIMDIMKMLVQVIFGITAFPETGMFCLLLLPAIWNSKKYSVSPNDVPVLCCVGPE